MTLLARAMILAMAAVSLSVLVGGAGLVSLGHAAPLGVGAYAVVALDAAGVTEGLAVLPAAAAAAALFALLTGAVAIRTSGVHFIMITLAFGQMAFFTAGSLTAYGGDDGYTLYGRTELFGTRLLEDRMGFHWVCLGLLALVLLFCRLLLASRFGRVLRASRENALRVRAVGPRTLPLPPARLRAHGRGRRPRRRAAGERDRIRRPLLHGVAAIRRPAVHGRSSAASARSPARSPAPSPSCCWRSGCRS